MGKYSLVFILAFAFSPIVLFNSVSADDCTQSDYISEYTECKPSTNTHSLIYYRDHASTCTGGLTQPDPKLGLPCNVSCAHGQYLAEGDTTCSNCAAGTVSHGGAIYVDAWGLWPTDFVSLKTYCKDSYSFEVLNSSVCAGWQLGDYYISSGDTDDYQTSVLEIGVILESPGTLNFNYLADAELNWDGLSLFVDGVNLFSKNSSTRGVFIFYSTQLEAGYHLISFEYFKDSSYSTGIDSALIQTLEVEGVYHAWNIQCDPCDEGQYAASGDETCSSCPSNTYSGQGSESCLPCLSTQYSYPGSAICYSRPVCTSDDFQVLGSQACTSANRQTLSGYWLSPHICTPGANLPPVTSQQCPPCDPGYYRDTGTQVCVACPAGKAGGGVGSGSCQTCPAGSSASKVISRTVFNYWNAYESTGCDGDCGGGGWRLRFDHIDSGQGHGAQVNSWYRLDVNLDTAGFLYFEHYFDCTGLCQLSFFDPYSGSATGITFDDQATTTDTTIPLTAGPHSLIFTFIKIGSESANDLAQIFNVTITSVAEGGSPACVTCAPGTTSSQGSTFCASCPIGQSSNSAGTACVPCSGNTYTPAVGSACIACNPGTVATSDHSDCVSPCLYAAADTLSVYNVSYDFSSLSPYFWTSLGPYIDRDFGYYINFCQKSNLGGICYGQLGNSIETYVCQLNNRVKWSIDLGQYAGYYPLPDSYPASTRGLEVQFTGGALGCAPFYGTAVARSTNVALVCDPLGGSGQLQGIVDQYGNDLTENPKCTYNFEVRSIYACPLCAQGSDWSYYYTPCNDNGKRLKVYYWLQNPPLCHDGVQPPALSEEVDCSHSNVVCPAGQFLDEPAGGVVCTNCVSGSYSLGGAEIVTNWPTADFFEPIPALPAPYTSFCSGTGCTLWRGAGQFVESGNVDSSLVVTYNFVQPGYVSFNYKVFSAKVGLFQFIVDINKTNLNTPGVTFFNFTSYTSGVIPAGRHQIVWHFVGGYHGPPSSGGLEGVTLSDVVVHGTDYHASQCLPCPAGTFADSGAATTCTPCPINTYSGGSAEECVACSDSTYSLGGIGASTCLPKPPCTSADYMKIYGPCINGSVDSYFELYYPSFCTDTYPFGVTESCGVCPPTLYWYDGECVTCGPEQHYNNNTGRCENIPLGYVNVQHKYYFIPFYFPGDPSIGKRDGEPTLDPDFRTGCSGDCVTNGWRATGVGADSGFHGDGAVDSWISITDTWPAWGKLIFTYNVLGDFGAFAGLQLLVDNDAIPIRIPYEETPQTEEVPIPPGTHTITWNFHHHAGDLSIAQIGPVELVGVDNGVAEAAACPAGTYNPNVGGEACLPCEAGKASNITAATDCQFCAPNTYASLPGTVQCQSCPPGTSAAGNGSMHCETSCIFSPDSSKTFDLSSLAATVGPVADETGNAFWFSVCARGNNASVCPDTHVCSKQGSSITSNGNALGFYLSKNNTGTAYFSLQFTGGDDGVNCLDGSKRSTIIDFTCDTQSYDSLPRFVATDANCTSYFTWATQLGCPVCKDGDYQLELGECDGISQSVTKVRAGLCNGQARVAQPTQGCLVPVTFPLAALLVPLFAFVALLGVAVVMFIRHRKITKQYSVLLASGGGTSRTSSIEMTSTPLFGASPPTSP